MDKHNKNLQLSGTARILLGIQLIPIAPGTDTFIQGFQNISEISFKVNNEIIIESLNPSFVTNYSNDNEYMELPRPIKRYRPNYNIIYK